MNRDIKRLHDGRVGKIIMKLAEHRSKIHPDFVRQHYNNTAAYGKFNTVEETNHIIQLYEEHMDNTKAAPPSVFDLERRLTSAINNHKSVAASHEVSAAETGRWRTAVTQAAAKVEDAQTTLGKAKLHAAIDLIDKVNAEAPAGSAARKDIEAMLERVMRQRMNNTLEQLGGYSGLFAKCGTLKVYVTDPARDVEILQAAMTAEQESKTAQTIANMQTNVGAGQPRQAKPSPYTPKLGDKVVLRSSWFEGSLPWVNRVVTIDQIDRLGVTYVGFSELRVQYPAHSCSDERVEPAPTTIKAGDTVRVKQGQGWQQDLIEGTEHVVLGLRKEDCVYPMLTVATPRYPEGEWFADRFELVKVA